MVVELVVGVVVGLVVSAVRYVEQRALRYLNGSDGLFFNGLVR